MHEIRAWFWKPSLRNEDPIRNGCKPFPDLITFHFASSFSMRTFGTVPLIVMSVLFMLTFFIRFCHFLGEGLNVKR